MGEIENEFNDEDLEELGNDSTENELEQKVKLVVETFKNDDLFNYIDEHYVLKEVLAVDDPFFKKIIMHSQKSYSTNQAAQLLERELSFAKSKTQTIVNYMQRDDFHNYLGHAKRNGRYRYDWILLFKLRMIFYLSNHGLRPSDIAEILGENFTTEIYSSNERGDSSERVFKQKKEHLDDLFQQVEERMLVLLAVHEKKMTLNYRQQEVTLKLETMTIRKSFLDKQRVALEHNKLLLEKITAERNNSKGGFFSKLFSKSNNEQDNKLILEGIDTITGEIVAVKNELVEIEEQSNGLFKEKDVLNSLQVEQYKISGDK
jgi:hypothetical protein